MPSLSTLANSDSLKRIAIVGPECTGKTSLSKSLASYFQTNWVPEYARDYLDNLDRPYNRSDLTQIAKGQAALEDQHAAHSKKILICDTTLLVVKIWSDVKYGSCDDVIVKEMQHRYYDLTFLTYIDIPWEYDPQREHPDGRRELFNRYVFELEQQAIDYVLIKGDETSRVEQAIKSINNLF